MEDLEIALSIGLQARIVKGKITNKRSLWRYGISLNLVPACEMLLETLHQRSVDDDSFPNIYYLRGLKIAVNIQLEAVIKEMKAFLDSMAAVGEKAKKPRARPPRRQVSPEVSEEQLQSIIASEIVLPEVQERPQRPEESTDQHQLRDVFTSTAIAEGDNMDPFAFGEITDAEITRMERAFDLTAALPLPIIQEEEEPQLPAGPEAPEVSDMAVQPLPVINETIADEIAEVTRVVEPVPAAQRAVQVENIVRRRIMTGRQRKTRAEQLEASTAYHDDYHEVPHLEDLENLEILEPHEEEPLLQVMLRFQVFRIPDAHEASAEGIVSDRAQGVDAAEGTEEPSALRAAVSAVSGDLGLNIGDLFITARDDDAQPPIMPLPMNTDDVIIASPQLPTIMECLEPMDVSAGAGARRDLTALLPEEYNSSNFTSRMEYILQMGARHPNEALSITDLTPKPHNARNIVTTFMLLGGLYKWKILNLVIDEIDYFVAAEFY